MREVQENEGRCREQAGTAVLQARKVARAAAQREVCRRGVPQHGVRQQAVCRNHTGKPGPQGGGVAEPTQQCRRNREGVWCGALWYPVVVGVQEPERGRRTGVVCVTPNGSVQHGINKVTGCRRAVRTRAAAGVTHRTYNNAAEQQNTVRVAARAVCPCVA